MTESFWRRCSSCKRTIDFGTRYWTCSVSTCNRKGSSFVFCSVGCWDMHLPTMRHREAWAEEQTSPTREQWMASSTPAVRRAPDPKPSRRDEDDEADAGTSPSASSGDDEVASVPLELRPSSEIEREVLIVASKLKKYVRARSGMNTSDAVMEVLSDRVRSLCDDAIARAAEDGRKTVMDRDF